MTENIEFTSSETIKTFVPGQNYELVGFVDAVEAPTKFGNKNLFKFVINSGDGLRVQVVSWNDQVQRTEREINLHHIIHLENTKSVPSTKFNRGNYFGAELSIQKFTVIENYGIIDRQRYNINNIEEIDIPEVELKDLCNILHLVKISVSGFIKTKFTVHPKSDQDVIKAFFILTDGNYKITVSINSYEENDLHIGDPVTVIGSIFRLKTEELCLNVDKMEDIKLIIGARQNVNWLLKGTKILFSNQAVQHKRQKIE
ncbi:uncharacterized protein LOC141532286 [Cotesia typhae]|uniref:uncharacterized protein LOC141532286 n=1 Tax=Cotesia typhae TaxID=2053667 RepID=UPI003D6927C9